MTLACKTQPPPQKLDVQLQFRFYKDGRPLGLDWDSIPELWIPAVWREDSGSYWCQAKTTPLRVKWSRRVQIQVHGEFRWGLCWAGLRRAEVRGWSSLTVVFCPCMHGCSLTHVPELLIIRVLKGSSLILAIRIQANKRGFRKPLLCVITVREGVEEIAA